jgi:hypothetical protein
MPGSALSRLAWAQTKAVGAIGSCRRLPPLRFLAVTISGATYSSRFVCAERYLQVTLVGGPHETRHEGFVLVRHQMSCPLWK